MQLNFHQIASGRNAELHEYNNIGCVIKHLHSLTKQRIKKRSLLNRQHVCKILEVRKIPTSQGFEGFMERSLHRKQLCTRGDAGKFSYYCQTKGRENCLIKRVLFKVISYANR